MALPWSPSNMAQLKRQKGIEAVTIRHRDVMPDTRTKVPGGYEFLTSAHEALSRESKKLVSTQSREIRIITLNGITSVPIPCSFRI